LIAAAVLPFPPGSAPRSTIDPCAAAGRAIGAVSTAIKMTTRVIMAFMVQLPLFVFEMIVYRAPIR
jgi:hypothetical protein